MSAPLTFIIIIIYFSTYPQSHLDHLWLLSDHLSLTPPIILRAVVRISTRGLFYTHPLPPLFFESYLTYDLHSSHVHRT